MESAREKKMKQAENNRQMLLTDVLKAVKQCQIRFGGGVHDVAVEEDEAVSQLCRSLEAVFHHGLKGGITASMGFSSSQPSFWRFIKNHLGRQDIERYLMLKNITSDLGRGRAWLRAALNERTLERHMHSFLSSGPTISSFYEPWAFMSDEERTSTLPAMSAGLSSILFAIKIDNPELNHPPVDEADDIVAQFNDDEAEEDGDDNLSTVSSNPSKKSLSDRKKKRKVQSHLVNFEGENDDDGERTRPLETKQLPTTTKSQSRSSTTTSARRSLEKQILISQTSSKTPLSSERQGRGREKANVLGIDFSPVNLRSSVKHGESEEDEIDIYSRSPETSKASGGDSRSLCSNDDGELPKELSSTATRLTPLKNTGVGALIPITGAVEGMQRNVGGGGGGNLRGVSAADDVSEDSMSIRSFGDESDYASVASGRAELQHNKRVPTVSVHSSSQYASAITREDLKQALLSVMARKDELQEQCLQLKKLLEQETSCGSALREEAAETKRKGQEMTDKMESRINTLSRENELLKHQLKKYVGAVQKLRDGPQAYETLARLEKGSECDEQRAKYVDYHYEASEYEKKLIQVAEMHGELIEFNEHLQKVVHSKDLAIQRMREELIDLRGPLPNEQGDDAGDAASETGGSDTASLASASVGNPTSRALLHIWIPSVFLSGTGTKTHHVYQVYLRIKDEEWNIYRRYSDFFALHRDLRRKESLVDTFDFPPKKTVGYKAEKVVEERRKRLQNYLRKIVNLLVQTNPALSARPNKENVLLLMPFFAENLGPTSSSTGTHSAHQRSQSQGRSIFNRRRTSTNPTPQLAL